MKSSTLDDLVANAKDLLEQLKGITTPDVAALKARVGSAIDSIQGTVRDTSAKAEVELREAADTVDQYVREYPWAAILITAAVAGAAGFVAGSTAGRDRR
jgi:ElaB/YqjD/DUF883 family membrane-anchored ribosome-binding protein